MKGLFLTSRRCKFQLVSSWISGVKLTNALHPRAPQRPAFQIYCFQHSILLTPSNWDGTLLQRVLDKQHILETFWKTACVSQRLGANHRSKESKFSFPPLSQIWHVSLSVWQASSHHVSPSLSLPLCRHDCVPGLSLNSKLICTECHKWADSKRRQSCQRCRYRSSARSWSLHFSLKNSP